MWTCPKCNRNFKSVHQSHSCTNIEAGELFLDKADAYVLAYDAIVNATSAWQPNSIGTAKNAIVFTSSKAWLIVRPMNLGLDVKFYYDSPIESNRFTKITSFYGKYAHHLRIKSVEQVDSDFIQLIRKGFDYSIGQVLN